MHGVAQHRVAGHGLAVGAIRVEVAVELGLEQPRTLVEEPCTLAAVGGERGRATEELGLPIVGALRRGQADERVERATVGGIERGGELIETLGGRGVALDEQHVGRVDGARGRAGGLEVGCVGGGDEVLERARQVAALAIDVGEGRVRTTHALGRDERVQELGFRFGVGPGREEKLAARDLELRRFLGLGQRELLVDDRERVDELAGGDVQCTRTRGEITVARVGLEQSRIATRGVARAIERALQDLSRLPLQGEAFFGICGAGAIEPVEQELPATLGA